MPDGQGTVLKRSIRVMGTGTEMKFVPGVDGLQLIHVADWSIPMHLLDPDLTRTAEFIVHSLTFRCVKHMCHKREEPLASRTRFLGDLHAPESGQTRGAHPMNSVLNLGVAHPYA